MCVCVCVCVYVCVCVCVCVHAQACFMFSNTCLIYMQYVDLNLFGVFSVCGFYINACGFLILYEFVNSLCAWFGGL